MEAAVEVVVDVDGRLLAVRCPPCNFVQSIRKTSVQSNMYSTHNRSYSNSSSAAAVFSIHTVTYSDSMCRDLLSFQGSA